LALHCSDPFLPSSLGNSWKPIKTNSMSFPKAIFTAISATVHYHLCSTCQPGGVTHTCARGVNWLNVLTESMWFQELQSSEHLSVCQRLSRVSTCFDKNTSGCTTTPLVVTSDKRCFDKNINFPGALSRLICHDFACFVLLRTLRGVNSYGSSAKLTWLC